MIGTSTPSFYLSAKIQKFTLGDGILEIGGSYNENSRSVVGDATFLIDYATVPLSLLVEIEAAINIPVLKSYATVNISISDEGASLEGKLNLFGLLKPIAKISWDWEFTFFKAELGDIIFAPGVLELKTLILDIQTQPVFIFLFDIQIRVLSFADLGATLEIEERNGFGAG